MSQHEIGPGHVLGRYELLHADRAGGMATVWAARLKGTRGFQKIVAVKTMLPKLSRGRAVRADVPRRGGARVAGSTTRTSCEILDLGEQDGVLYLVDGVDRRRVRSSA